MESYIRYLAARWFHKHSTRLAKQLPGIRKAEDIEYVHRARVASRRLRAALELFADWPSPKQHKRWRKHIRRIGRSLGTARDMDVQLLFLCDRWPDTEGLSVRVGLAQLILWRQTQREVLQKKVLRAVDRLERSGLLQEIRKTAARILKKEDFSEEQLRQSPLWEEAVRQIERYVKQMESFASCLDDPEDQQQHHAMRIAAKHLRYTLEILEPIFGPEIQPTIQALQIFQTLMGQVHDCQVWVEELTGLEEGAVPKGAVRKREKKAGRKWQGVSRAVQVAITWLQEDRRLAQSEFFQQAGRHWRQCLQGEITDRLSCLVQKASLRSGRKPLPRRSCLVLAGDTDRAGPRTEAEQKFDIPHKYTKTH